MVAEVGYRGGHLLCNTTVHLLTVGWTHTTVTLSYYAQYGHLDAWFECGTALKEALTDSKRK